MYDIFLSPQWYFDRCLEASSHPFIFMGLATVILFVATAVVIRQSSPKKHLLFNYARNTSKLILLTALALTLLLLAYIDFISLTEFPGYWFVLFATLVILPVLLVLYFLSFRSIKKARASQSLVKQWSFSILSLVLIIPIIFILYTGTGIFTCSAGAFWSGLTPAHAMHAQLKTNRDKNGAIPRSETELADINPQIYKQITSNAKSSYVYNSTNNTYTWFVRPSRYVVAVFDSSHDYSLYNILYGGVSFSYFSHTNWPPDYPGPWNQLPN